MKHPEVFVYCVTAIGSFILLMLLAYFVGKVKKD